MRTDALSLFVDYVLDDVASPEAAVGTVIDGMDELGDDTGKRPIQCFTMKMPPPLFLEFKKLSQQAKKLSSDEKKDNCTMTACATSLVQKVGIPALRQLAAELEALALTVL
jgi:hypothetical protein